MRRAQEAKPGFGASNRPAIGSTRITRRGLTKSHLWPVRHAESKGYKMSAAVPFLPMSPALEGIPGEEEGFDPMGFSLAIDIRWLREA